MMSAQDPGSKFELGMSTVNERLEQQQLEREVRAAGPNGLMDALRRKLSVMLVRLSGWVNPAEETAADPDSALIRLAR